MINFIIKHSGDIIGVIGLIAGYVFYHLSKMKAILAYQINSIKIIDEVNQLRLDDIEIKYKDIIVNNLSKSNIIIWNNGNKTIEGKNIINKDRLRIAFEGYDGKILYAKIIKATRDVNNFTINKINNNEIEIDFDFLDPKDGVIIEILHSFHIEKIVLKGTIKEMPNGIKNLGYTDDMIKKSKKKLVDIFFSPVFLAIIFTAFVCWEYVVNINQLTNSMRISILLLGIVIIYQIFLYKMKSSKFPEKLKFDKINKKNILTIKSKKNFKF